MIRACATTPVRSPSSAATACAVWTRTACRLPSRSLTDRVERREGNEQMSLFAPLAARALAETPGGDPESDEMHGVPEPEEDDALVLELAPVPRAPRRGCRR